MQTATSDTTTVQVWAQALHADFIVTLQFDRDHTLTPKKLEKLHLASGVMQVTQHDPRRVTVKVTGLRLWENRLTPEFANMLRRVLENEITVVYPANIDGATQAMLRLPSSQMIKVIGELIKAGHLKLEDVNAAFSNPANTAVNRHDLLTPRHRHA